MSAHKYKKLLNGERKSTKFFDRVFEEVLEETAQIQGVKVSVVRAVITDVYRQIANSMRNPTITHIYIRYLGTFKRFKQPKKNETTTTE